MTINDEPYISMILSCDSTGAIKYHQWWRFLREKSSATTMTGVSATRIFPGLLLVVLLILFIVMPVLYTHLTTPTPKHPPLHHFERIPMERLPNGLYSIQVSVGTPGQPVMVIVDTGASLSWVMDVSCGRVDNVLQNDPIQHRYDPLKSSTHKSLNRSLYKHYRTGEWIRAAVSTDTITIGSLHISSVHLGRVTDTNCDAHSSGLLAVSPRHYEGSVLDRIKKAKRLRHLTIQWHNDRSTGRSSLCFGVPIDNHINTTTSSSNHHAVMVPCLKSRWIVPVSIRVGQDTDTACDALIDTASTHIFLPDTLVQQVRQHRLVRYDRKTERAHYCGTDDQLSELPIITVTINSHPASLHPTVYIDGDTKEVLLACLKTTFASAPYSAILGLPFITKCCESVLFDIYNVSIGFVYSRIIV